MIHDLQPSHNTTAVAKHHALSSSSLSLLLFLSGGLLCRQNPTPNAYTLAIRGKKPFIVLHTSLVDLMKPEVCTYAAGLAGWPDRSVWGSPRRTLLSFSPFAPRERRARGWKMVHTPYYCCAMCVGCLLRLHLVIHVCARVGVKCVCVLSVDEGSQLFFF